METLRATSQIHDDWHKIQTAISSLSDKTLDDCVKRLNELVFNKLSTSKSSKVDESKHDISMEIFDKIMSEIDDDVKTQHLDKENKNKYKGQYVGKERRQFIRKPVMLYCIFILMPFFNICFDCVALFVYVLIGSLLN